MRWFLCIAVVAILQPELLHSAKILAVFASLGYSQFFVGLPLLKQLAKRGHEITLLSPHKPKQSIENIEHIHASGILQMWEGVEFNFFDFINMDILSNIKDSHAVYGVAECEELLKDAKVQSLLRSDRTFDLVLLEFWSGESLMALANHFNAPLVVFNTIGASDWVNHLVSNPAPFSYVPHTFSGLGTNMILWERVQNYFLQSYFLFLKHFVLLPKHEQLIKKYFPNPPDIQDVVYNASLILLNSHPSVTPAYPLVSNMIEIGGFHIESEAVPQDLQKFLDDAPNGVIYFCMGTNLRSKDMGEERINQILKVFAGLKEKVLWKFEAEELPNKPNNVAIRKWLPQRAVLAHPNVKLFISHCGMIGTIESVYYGKPIVCIPVFVDQATNAQLLRIAGIATVLDFKELNENTLRSAVSEVLNNKRYTKNAYKRSQYFRESPVKPMDLATFWIEFVIKHRGAPHLRNPGLNLRWYEYYYLDVAGIALVIFYILIKLLKSVKGKRRKQKRA